MHVALWQFQVRPGREAEFEHVYGPDGDWVRLLRQAPGYLGTELWRDDEAEGRYLNVDKWKSSLHRRRFRRESAAAYEELDRKCEELTVAETNLGCYTWEESYPSRAPPIVDFLASASPAEDAGGQDKAAAGSS